MIHKGDNVRESVMYADFDNMMQICKKGKYKDGTAADDASP